MVGLKVEEKHVISDEYGGEVGRETTSVRRKPCWDSSVIEGSSPAAVSNRKSSAI